MPESGYSHRHTVLSAPRATTHGALVYAEGFVGVAFRVKQADAFDRPGTVRAIAQNEEYELQVGGVHAVNAPSGHPLFDANPGDLVYISKTTDAVRIGTAAGHVPVGVVDEVDELQPVPIIRINADAWQAFLPGA